MKWKKVETRYSEYGEATINIYWNKKKYEKKRNLLSYKNDENSDDWLTQKNIIWYIKWYWYEKNRILNTKENPLTKNKHDDWAYAEEDDNNTFIEFKEFTKKHKGENNE